MYLMKAVLLVLAPLVLEAVLLGERNDISCSQGACVLSTYRLEYEGGAFRLRATARGRCSPSYCAGCALKSGWLLAVRRGTYLLVRRTENCVAQTTALWSQIFPAAGAPVPLISCAEYRCSKSVFTLTASTLIRERAGACADSNCQACRRARRWRPRGPLLERSTDSCQAPQELELRDFFVVPANLLAPPPPGEDGFWTGARIFAVFVSCCSFVTLVTALSALFCRK